MKTGGVDNKPKEANRDYLYQIIMIQGCTEYALMVNLAHFLVYKIPLEHPVELANPSLPFQVSFINEDNDWVGEIEGEAPQRVVEANITDSHGAMCHFLKCPGAEHNLHRENPKETKPNRHFQHNHQRVSLRK
jgi:hypothetical protein